MNNIDPDFNDFYNQDDSKSFTEVFFKYLFFWKYFLISIISFVFLAYLINRYTPKLFEVNAKVQILDKKQNNFEMPSSEDLFSNSKINLANEIELITSTNILNEVIDNLNLNSYVEVVGELMTSRELDYPFEVTHKVSTNSVGNKSFRLEIDERKLIIYDRSNDKEYVFNNLSTIGLKHDLPFEISNIKIEDWKDNSFNVNYVASSKLISGFKKNIKVSEIGKNSDIIQLNFNNQIPEYAVNVLNEIIRVFNNDGVRDRQEIHKRTIDFVNDRYKYLSSELETIELEKQSYKTTNKLVDLSLNSTISLEKNSIFEESLLSNENQIFLVDNLLNELTKTDFKLLPSNIGLENLEVNSLISSYNNLYLERQKLNTSAGPNNPYLIQLDNSLKDTRENIIFSLNNYLSQLNIIRDNIKIKSNVIQNNVASFPSKEKNLRAIERNQQIKEALYLFLLQKGEEAQVSYAVTEPSIKVVEYGYFNKSPIYPKTNMIFLFAILIGFLIPFLIIYITFLFDNKIHNRDQIEKKSLDLVGEIPFFALNESEKIFSKPEDRSIISESYRILMSNLNYFQKSDSDSNVILVTSSIKGEGKTLNSLNLALSFSSIGKKTLLIGADLRNPQLHKYIGYDKNVSGLVDFLVDKNVEWQKKIINPFEHQKLDMMLSGPVPPNSLNLINNGNIDILLKKARKIYDYIILDSAPTLLVADTKSLFNKVDMLLFVTRANYTQKDILDHISKISKDIDLNVGIILNGVGQKNSYGYSYGYKYGYGYNYKYSYNYGYGYGYSSDND